VATATVVIVVLTPANFYHFTFETFGKKLVETKIIAKVNVKKIKAKK
jgi:hypothetical protein